MITNGSARPPLKPTSLPTRRVKASALALAFALTTTTARADPPQSVVDDIQALEVMLTKAGEERHWHFDSDSFAANGVINPMRPDADDRPIYCEDSACLFAGDTKTPINIVLIEPKSASRNIVHFMTRPQGEVDIKQKKYEGQTSELDAITAACEIAAVAIELRKKGITVAQVTPAIAQATLKEIDQEVAARVADFNNGIPVRGSKRGLLGEKRIAVERYSMVFDEGVTTPGLVDCQITYDAQLRPFHDN